jgi:hypothetical protein
MTSAESEFQLASRGITGVPPDALSKVETSAVSDAAPAGQQRGLPLVVLSPGFTGSRNTLTALAEDLASHGYVVAGIDHTYESFATAFPDGRVATCLARERRGGGFWEKVGPAGPAVAALSRGRVLFPVARLPEFGSEPCPGVSCERECPAPCPEGMRALSVEVMSPRHRDHARLSSRMDTWITDAKTT